MKIDPVFILGGARTPMTEYTGSLKDVSALELGAIASRGAFEKTGVQPAWVDHAVFGNVPFSVTFNPPAAVQFYPIFGTIPEAGQLVGLNNSFGFGGHNVALVFRSA